MAKIKILYASRIISCIMFTVEKLLKEEMK